jgi:hypothetical protein
VSDERPPSPAGTIRAVSPVRLAVVGILGLVLGWLAHPLSVQAGGSAPVVTWPQPLLLGFVAVALGRFAWDTRASVRDRARRLEPHRAVNRLAFGRAAAYVASVLGGGYAGYALSWVDSRAELALHRVVWSGSAAVAALAVVVCGVLLERACRVGLDDDEA